MLIKKEIADEAKRIGEKTSTVEKIEVIRRNN